MTYKKTFSVGDIVRFKEGLHQDLVLVNQEQFDQARAHYNDPARKVGEQTALIESGEYVTIHPGNYMTVAACRPTSLMMLVLGDSRRSVGFSAGFVPASLLEIVQ